MAVPKEKLSRKQKVVMKRKFEENLQRRQDSNFNCQKVIPNKLYKLAEIDNANGKPHLKRA